MRYAILRDLGVSSVLCLSERMLERLVFPGVNRMAERITVGDPARADDLTTLIAETLGVMALVWLFTISLYVISYLSRRPLRPYATTLVTCAILMLIFMGAYGQWMTMPPRPR